jgi:4-carboxymuconolactone decarboxylase
MSPSVPLQPVRGRASELLESFDAEVSDLYRALANNPDVLETWIGMAWSLRTKALTPRALRELMILRAAHTEGATYQWSDHTVMARDAGVSEAKIDAVPTWEKSDLYSVEERLALTLIDDMLAGDVSDATLVALEERFDPSQRVELIVTAGFYCMVPRVLDALRLNG